MAPSKHTPPETVKRIRELIDQGTDNQVITSRMRIKPTTLKRIRKSYMEEKAKSKQADDQ